MKKNTLMIVLIAVLAVVVLVSAVMMFVVLGQSIQLQQEDSEKMAQYKAAEALLEQGRYDEAIKAFAQLGNYKDSPKRVQDCMNARDDAAYLPFYNQALSKMQEGKFAEAKALLDQMPNYRDVQTLLSRFHFVLLEVSVQYRGMDMDTSKVNYTYTTGGVMSTGKYYYSHGTDSQAVEDLLISTYEGGRLVRFGSDKRAFTYTYDEKGRLSKVEYAAQEGQTGYEDFSFQYLQGQICWNNGDSITYTYDDAGNVTKAQVCLSQNYLGDFLEEYTRDESGKIVSAKRTYQAATEVYTYTYDDAGRLATVKLTEKNGKVPAEAHGLTYQYDTKGNLIGVFSDSGLGVEYKFGRNWTYCE